MIAEWGNSACVCLVLNFNRRNLWEIREWIGYSKA